MNYMYNPGAMLKIRQDNRFSKKLDKALNGLLERGQEIDINTVDTDILNELLSLSIAVRDNDKIIFNPTIFIFCED